MDFDVTSISAVVAAAGVLVGVVYYILDMRHQRQVRQTELVMKLQTAFSTKEMVEAMLKYLSKEYTDYDDFTKKYGSPIGEGQVQTVFAMVGMFFEGMGILLKNKLVDINLVTQYFTVEAFWLKMKPLAEGMRKQTNIPGLYEWFEYLYNEVKKREQKLQQSKA